MINNVVVVSGVQRSDSVIHIHVSIPFQILFPFRLLHNTEQSSLCYIVGPCLSQDIDYSSLCYTVGPCLSQDIDYSSLCYTVGPCCLSILYIVACIC